MMQPSRSPSKINSVLVVGAGAVGGYFGALLFQSGIDLRFLVRPATFQKISSAGLKIQSSQGNFLIHPPLVQRASEIEDVDLIILAVKCHDLAPILPEIAPLIKKGAVILTLQNGVSTEDFILSYFQKPCVVAGVAYITAKRQSPGVIEHSRRGIISLGEMSGEKSDRAREIVALLTNAGISCRLTTNIRRAKWEKLCWNATFNPLSVILNHPISLVLEEPALVQVVRDGIKEVIAVAAVEGIEIRAKIIEETISSSYDLKDFYTSMYEDYRNGKKTEIDHLNGDIVNRGGKHGIPTPIHQMLYALVKGLETKNGL